MRLLVVITADVRRFVEIVESKEPARAAALEVVRGLRRAGHRFGEVRSVQVFELGELLYTTGAGWAGRSVEEILERQS